MIPGTESAGSAALVSSRGGDPTPTYLPVHSPRSEGSSVCVCVCCVCVCVFPRRAGQRRFFGYAQHLPEAMNWIIADTPPAKVERLNEEEQKVALS